MSWANGCWTRGTPLFDRLDGALQTSVLPEEPATPSVAALEAWLLKVRRERL